MKLISINEAAAAGIERLRYPKWVTPEDHLKIDIIDGKPGLWTHLFAPFNRECNGRDPVSIICTQMDYGAAEWEPYTGPISGSDEYKAAQACYDGCLGANDCGQTGAADGQ
jgi:hypothetical protein